MLADVNERIDWVFNFVSENSIHPVNRPTDDYPDWYYKHSSVYVANDHLAFSQDKQRRVRKKHGKLIQSNFNDINDMLLDHKAQVMEKCLEMTAPWRKEQQKEQAKKDAAEKKRLAQMDKGGDDYIRNSNSAQLQQGGIALSYNGLGLQSGYTTPNEMARRGSPSASPNVGPGGLKSPIKNMPPMGRFTATTPERTAGTRSPMFGGSPSRKPPSFV
jgi:hypothetical protein